MIQRSVAVFGLLFTILLTGCITTGKGVDKTAVIKPIVDPVERKTALLTLPVQEQNQYCWGSEQFVPLSEEARITGAIERQNSNAQSAGNAILENVESWYGGNERTSELLRESLSKGARIKAFTKIRPYNPSEYTNYNPMNEPVYQVSNFLLALAHGYAILKEEYSEDTELLTAVRQWGDELFRLTSTGSDDFIGRVGGVDRRFQIAQGWAHWGNITGNREALDRAYQYYVHGMQAFGRGGNSRIWQRYEPKKVLYYTNMTVSAALPAAYALFRSGAEDVYELKPGGGTIVEGASWLWERLSEEYPFDLMRARHSGSRAVAWTEIFVSEFPNHPAARKMDYWLEEQMVPRYAYTGGGGPSTCLYRKI